MLRNDDDAISVKRDLNKQIFQLAYFGKMNPEYVSFLEVGEKNYIYDLLVEQLKEEKKQKDEEEKKVRSSMPKSHPRR